METPKQYKAHVFGEDRFGDAVKRIGNTTIFEKIQFYFNSMMLRQTLRLSLSINLPSILRLIQIISWLTSLNTSLGVVTIKQEKYLIPSI